MQAHDKTRHFLLELDTDGSLESVPEVTARARAAVMRARGRGADISFVRSVYAPESDSLFLVYRASSQDAVLSAASDAQLLTARVSSALLPNAERAPME